MAQAPRVNHQVFITHLLSIGPLTRDNGINTADGGTTTTLTLTGGGFGTGADPIVVGDVLRLTSGTGKGQASIVSGVAADVLTVSPAFDVAPANGTGFRVEPPRQHTDVSEDVVSLEVRDYQEEVAQLCFIELNNPDDGYYSSRFEKGDPVEVWIEDGDDVATNAVDFSLARDRCFVGRVEKVTRNVEGSGLTVIIQAKDYTADTIEQIAHVASTFLPYVSASTNRNVYYHLGRIFNADRGRFSDTACGIPTFDFQKSGIGAALGQIKTPVPDQAIAFVGDTYFDAFLRLASTLQEATTDEACIFWIDSLTYEPRRAGTKPTAYLHTPTDANTGNITLWSIAEGENVIDADPVRDGVSVRNKITLLSETKDGIPLIVTKSAASGDGVLGTDRWGVLHGVSRAKGFADPTAASAAVDSALLKTKLAKERRRIKRRGVVEPGARLSGREVTVQVASAGISSQSLGIVGVRHRLTRAGLVSDFDLTFIRPGWDRLLPLIEARGLEEVYEQVWQHYYLYEFYIDNGSPGNFPVYRVSPTRMLTTTAAERELLLTATSPSAAGTWVFVDAKFLNGRLFFLWRNNVTADKAVIKVYDAYSATLELEIVLDPVGFTAIGTEFAQAIWPELEDDSFWWIWIRDTQEVRLLKIAKDGSGTTSPEGFDAGASLDGPLIGAAVGGAQRFHVIRSSKYATVDGKTLAVAEGGSAPTVLRGTYDRRKLSYLVILNGAGTHYLPRYQELSSWLTSDVIERLVNTNQASLAASQLIQSVECVPFVTFISTTTPLS